MPITISVSMLLPALAPAIIGIELLFDSKMTTFCKVLHSWIIRVWRLKQKKSLIIRNRQTEP